MAMESKELAKMDSAKVMEQVVVGGDLSKLTPVERVNYYVKVCESVGLNALTKPFAYITLNGRLTLYATRDCADQLRRRDGVSLEVTAADVIGDLYVVRVRAKLADGRTDEDTGAVSIANLKGDALANATMKAITKAKRRATLSICGLGWLDETEIETIADAKPVQVDAETGEIDDGDSDFLVIPCEDCHEPIPNEIVMTSKNGTKMNKYPRDLWLNKCKAKFRADLCVKCSMDRAAVLKGEAEEAAA